MYKNTATCLLKSADDEPIFVLVARDKLAVRTVVAWISYAARTGVSDAKIADAQSVASAMLEWQNTHKTHTPD
jgi:hypothetical protein